MRLKRKLPTVIITVVAAVVILVNRWPGPVGDTAVTETVRPFTICRSSTQQHCVVDGDTMRYGGEIIRLEDIDTPEIRSAKCPSEKALGERAKRRLLDLLNEGRPMEAVYTGGRDEDRYGRKLRVIEIDGRSVGDTLFAEGLARPWGGRRRSWCG